MKRVRVKNTPFVDETDALGADKYLPSQSVFIDYKDTPSYLGKDGACNYSNKVLIGPWYEERQDLRNICRGATILSPYRHYFSTIYDSNYNTHPLHRVPAELWGYSNHPNRRKWRAYPSHQPELDCSMSCFCPWETTYCAAYVKHPIVCKECPKKDTNVPCQSCNSQ